MVSFLVPHADSLSGAGCVMHGQLTALRDRHEISLVTLVPTEAGDRKALERLRATRLPVHVLGESWPVTVIRCKRRIERLLGRARGWPAMGNPMYADPRLPRFLDRLMARQRFDILQVEDVGIGRFNYRSPIPSLLVEHEVRDETHQQTPIWGQFDHIQVFTGRDAAALCREVPALCDQVSINPFGVEIPETDSMQREEADTMLFAGGFNHRPNVDAALWLGREIMPLLRSLRPNARLWIVGSAPPKQVRDLANGNIVVTGRVPSIDRYLSRAAVVLAPLRLGGGMRVKVLQAMARAKPVVATPLAAEGLASGRSQPPIAVAGDAAEIARATAGLLASAEARERLGRRAQEYVRAHHSWSAYRRRLESVYADLTGPVARRRHATREPSRSMS